MKLPDVLCQEEDDLYHSAKEACGSDLAARVHNGAGSVVCRLSFLCVFCVVILNEEVPSVHGQTVHVKTDVQIYQNVVTSVVHHSAYSLRATCELF